MKKHGWRLFVTGTMICSLTICGSVFAQEETETLLFERILLSFKVYGYGVQENTAAAVPTAEPVAPAPTQAPTAFTPLATSQPDDFESSFETDDQPYMNLFAP